MHTDEVQLVEQTVHLAAAPADVWRALTEPTLLARWYGGATIPLTFDGAWVAGGEVRLLGTLNEKPLDDRIAVHVAEPPRRLVYDYFSSVARGRDTPDGRTTVTLSLTPDGSGTTLHVRQEGFRLAVSTSHARFFWRGALADLARLLAPAP